MGTKATRIVLDVLLTIMIVAEMFIQYTGNFLHEIIGFTFFATVVIHLLLSAKWMKSTARAARKGKLSGRHIALAVLASLLAVDMLVLGVSSIAISDILASTGFTWTFGSYSMWVTVHSLSSYALCALVVVHLAMHWAFLASAFKVPYNPERRRAIGVGVHAVAAVGAVALGVTTVQKAIPQAIAQTPSSSEASPEEQFEGVSDKPRKKEKSSGSSGAPSASAPSSSSGSNVVPDEGSQSTESESNVSGICTLCRKQCPLSNPKCDKPYAAGLI